MHEILHLTCLLLTAALFGGMLLFAAALAAFLFAVLPVTEARRVIRRAFPPFYLLVMGTSALAAVSATFVDATAALALGAIALSVLPTRQMLMPAINRATDAGQRSRFARLHGLSVGVTLTHIGVAGWVLARLAG